MQTPEKRFVSLLGLAQRARQVVSGEDTVYRALVKKKVTLLIVAEDSSENTCKQWVKWSESFQVPLRFYQDRGTLGKAIGKEWRAVVGITDVGFAKAMQQLIDDAAE